MRDVHDTGTTESDMRDVHDTGTTESDMRDVHDLEIGAWVGFTKASGNPDTGKSFQISGKETHQGRMFYRLRQREGGLFVRESLYA